MVSLIDQDIQYFVAEASKTLHLDDMYELAIDIDITLHAGRPSRSI
jgi:hypothetical protein